MAPKAKGTEANAQRKLKAEIDTMVRKSAMFDLMVIYMREATKVVRGESPKRVRTRK